VCAAAMHDRALELHTLLVDGIMSVALSADGPLWCVDTVARKRGRDGQLTKAQVLKKVAGGKKSELECSGTLLATYVFSNAGFWLDYQANISDAKTKQEWVVDQSSSVSVASSRPSAAERIRRLQLRGDTSLQPHKPGRRDPAELLQDYHTKLMQFHADALEAAGYSPDDIEPPRWGYQGNWNSYTALDAISATSPGSVCYLSASSCICVVHFP
jgi:hypothetical protein